MENNIKSISVNLNSTKHIHYNITNQVVEFEDSGFNNNNTLSMLQGYVYKLGFNKFTFKGEDKVYSINDILFKNTNIKFDSIEEYYYIVNLKYQIMEQLYLIAEKNSILNKDIYLKDNLDTCSLIDDTFIMSINLVTEHARSMAKANPNVKNIMNEAVSNLECTYSIFKKDIINLVYTDIDALDYVTQLLDVILKGLY